MTVNRWAIVILTIFSTVSSLAYGYRVTSERYSYFLLDKEGNLKISGGMPITNEGIYYIPVAIQPTKTAIVVMDPWIDMADNFLNSYFGKVTVEWMLPLINQAKKSGHEIVILTNDPHITCYNTQIDISLAEMVDNKHVHLLYHQTYTDNSFAEWLKAKNINTLIYTGYASNQCIIGRQMGMIHMKEKGFRVFFVPEASAACEMSYTWESQMLHHATTTIISLWIGNVIHWTEFMKATAK